MTEFPNNLDTVLHLGAGRCEELPSYLASDAQRILLVEPNPTLAEALRRQTAQDERVQVIELAVTDELSLNQLNEYNLPEAASLYRPSGLRDLYPGLRITAQHAVNTITPEQLLAQFPLEGERNLLVIQTPGAELLILKTLAQAKLLEAISHIWLTCPRDTYYENASRADDTLAELERAGYQVETEHDSQSDWPQWRLTCNPMARKAQALELEKEALTAALKSGKSELEYTKSSLEAVKTELADARKDFGHQQQAWETQKHELTSRLEKAMQHSSELDRTVAKLQEREVELGAALSQANTAVSQLRSELENTHEQQNALKAKHDNDIDSAHLQMQANQQALEAAQAKQAELHERLKQIDDAKQEEQKAREQAEKSAEALAQRITQLEQQLSEAQAGQTQFNDLKQRMEYLFDQQGLQLEQAANALGRHISSTAKNTSRELQAGIALQQQLGAAYGLEEHGNRLPATVALQLSRQIKTQPYDLIIEMGSGVTTSFLAHTLRKQAQNDDGGSETNGTSVARYVEPSEDDLPKRILCFEHSRATVKALEQSLKQSSLSPSITLQYAPLVSYQYQGNEYHYYDCARRLQQVAQLFENRDARILVLLNDTTGDSRPDRVAALPQLLQYLSAHSLDVVINSASADSELITQWHQLLDSRGLDYQPATEFGSAAAQLVKVNP